MRGKTRRRKRRSSCLCPLHIPFIIHPSPPSPSFPLPPLTTPPFPLFPCLVASPPCDPSLPPFPSHEPPCSYDLSFPTEEKRHSHSDVSPRRRRPSPSERRQTSGSQRERREAGIPRNLGRPWVDVAFVGQRREKKRCRKRDSERKKERRKREAEGK